MEMIKWLENWYKSQCDGDWEHMFGIKIDTLDNPGWNVEIDIADTELEDKPFNEYEYNLNDDNDWMFCQVKNGKFDAAGDPNKLGEIIKIFKEWVEN